MAFLDSAARVSSHRTPGILNALRGAFALYAQRRALSRLDDAMLADIGVTRHEAKIEANRPLWDVPANWRQ